jgi:hypothetical protein
MPFFFALWEHQVPYLFAPPSTSDGGWADWRINLDNLALDQGRSFTRSRKEIQNKIYGMYSEDSESGAGPAVTPDAVEDKLSQRQYGVVEGVLNVGQSVEYIDVLRRIAIKTRKNPEKKYDLAIQGRVQHMAGYFDYPYVLRAGMNVRLVDIDSAILSADGSDPWSDAGKAFVYETSYTAQDNRISLRLGLNTTAFELLMSRTGVGA